MQQNLIKYLSVTKKYITDRSDTFIGLGVVGGIVLVIVIGILINKALGPQIVYQPIKACEAFTPNEAQNLMNRDKVINTDTKDLQFTGDTATSKCAYTDQNPDNSAMLVAAVAIRSGINDKGVQQNKNDFAAARSNNNTDTVTGIGDSAYFNKTSGQLNVLKQRSWYIFSYSTADSTAAGSVDQAITLARKVL